LFDYTQVGMKVSYIELSLDSKLACDQTGIFSLADADVSDKICIFICGQLVCKTKANPANSSFFGFCSFVIEQWKLPKEREFVFITYLDDENIECILNEAGIFDALTESDHPIVHFRVYLSAADRNRDRPFRPFQ
jgi:hypothetical protein